MDVPWYFRNENTRRDLKMPTVSEQIALKIQRKDRKEQQSANSRRL